MRLLSDDLGVFFSGAGAGQRARSEAAWSRAACGSGAARGSKAARSRTACGSGARRRTARAAAAAQRACE